MSRDPLAAAELRLVIDEATSDLRHDMRNKLGSIRNMAFYVLRKLKQDGTLLERDPRLEQFLKAIESEVEAADKGFDLHSEVIDRLHVPSLSAPVGSADALQLAVDSLRVNGSPQVVTTVDDMPVHLDRHDLAVALRCLIENAIEAGGADRTVRVTGRADGAIGYVYEVVDEGGGVDPVRCRARFQSTKPGHVGLGINVAARVARQAAGDVSFEREGAGTRTTMSLPTARAHQDYTYSTGASAPGPGPGGAAS